MLLSCKATSTKHLFEQPPTATKFAPAVVEKPTSGSEGLTPRLDARDSPEADIDIVVDPLINVKHSAANVAS